MKYTVGIDIEAPRERVAALLADPANYPKWQRGFQRAEPLEGEPGTEGAKSKLVYDFKGRKMEMIETIVARELPERIVTVYDTKSVHNRVENRLAETAPDRTRLESENLFEFRGFMTLMGFLMKGAFPRQTLKYMEDFKAFAEQGKDVREGR